MDIHAVVQRYAVKRSGYVRLEPGLEMHLSLSQMTPMRAVNIAG